MPAAPAAAKALFLEAVAIDDPAARAALVAERCGEDSELLARVQALLDANERVLADAGTASFDGAGRVESTADYPGKDERAGAVIGGKYTLVEPIGEGGMGSVWRAKQTEPVKRFVAVKLIKAGMDSKQVLARFEAERQALALMDHPNIAKVLDGGLHDGRPFFVMELVKGVPITEYCDANKFSPRQRLELFVPVCQAIQHAHQKGIIHRDIKPSNVLVAPYDDKPVVKVIDFGVAKATGGTLTERTIDTGLGGVVGTPEYMSPEQATFNNLDIDTRSDMYALGVLLYELLAGSPPFARKELEKKGLLEILRVVREEEPPRPSIKLSTADALPTLSANRSTEPKSLTGLLRNELDWIVMKALEKDRGRRYETANSFSADVPRFLGGEAIQAHPPSMTYRMKKFVRRNKGQMIAVTFVVLAVVAGSAGTALGLSEPKRKAQVITASLVLVSLLVLIAGAMLGLIEAKRQEQIAREMVAEKEKARQAETERAMRDRLARLDDESFLEELAAAYKVAGKLDLALPLFEETLKRKKAKLGPEHTDTLTSMSNLAAAYQSIGKHEMAIQLLQECLAIREKTERGLWTTFDTQSLLGGALLGQKKYAAAEPLLLNGYAGMKTREKTIPAPGIVRILEALDRLIELYTALDKPDEVKKWHVERAKYPINAPMPQTVIR